ncbi:thioredoxin-dependent thiol peroxidase [Gryllotalpicola ginsengisoli]|uniref:thioredoxin-dependent thiol peroxidase n=1 Tax=Gryllotalpicola ginsengisoli TaxID=444608 RepID=UPI0003B74C41|nr:thioredoxin-dependent thiol peroxidase [Gryllotalpicola ginsengisoli]
MSTTSEETLPSSIRLAPGDRAPGFTLPDKDGRPVSLSDFAGEDVIVYFYPAASTPACTTQACDFRDNLGELADAGYAVLGVSKDAPAALAAFAAAEHLDFPLLSDESLEVHRAYGVWGQKQLYGKTVVGVLRSTFVVRPDGTLAHALYNVKAKGHLNMLRKKLKLA